MFYLIIVSFIWAFSFGIIKTQLSGVDATAAATLRLAFAFLIFLPLLRPGKISWKNGALLLGIGAIQYGVMYAVYMSAFAFLQAHEVALFTIFTPIYVTLLNAIFEKKFEARWLLAVAFAVVAAGVILWDRMSGDSLVRGFFLVQISDACFAFGQVAYKRLRPSLSGLGDTRIFGWLLLGGFLATFLYSLNGTDWKNFHATPAQWAVLFYLGTVASGIGFFLWNRGVMRVNAGTLAVFNNLKIPLTVVCSLIFFNAGGVNFPRLILSFVLMLCAIRLAQTENSHKK